MKVSKHRLSSMFKEHKRLLPDEEEEERKRVVEVLFATPMRNFTKPRSQRTGGGTLKVRVISYHSSRLRQSTTARISVAQNLNSFLGTSRKTSSDSSPSPSPLDNKKKSPHHPQQLFFVEASVGSAKGRTDALPLSNARKGEFTFGQQQDGSQHWIRLFVPDEDEAQMLQAVRDALLRGDTKAPSQMLLQKHRILHLKLETIDGPKKLDLETAVDLDRWLELFDEIPVLLHLPWVSRSDPEELDLGSLNIEVMYERRILPEHNRRLRTSIVTNDNRELVTSIQHMLPQNEEEFEHMTTTTMTGDGILLMAPSAVALLAACCKLAADSTSSGADDDALSDGGHPQRRQRRRKRFNTFAASGTSLQMKPPRVRFPSMPHLQLANEESIVCNKEQLAGLREGWRMWQLADKTQYQPSHRAQDAARVGERFLNREAASSFYDSSTSNVVSMNLSSNTPPMPQMMFTRPTKKQPEVKDAWCRKKCVLLTGGTSGIGKEIGLALCARKIKRLILLCRDFSQGRNQARDWSHKFKGLEVDVIQCDLRSMMETVHALNQVTSLLEDAKDKLDLVVLCAATINAGGNQHDERGEFEESFAVNYMSNFLIVNSLLRHMEETRIVLTGCANSFKGHTFDVDMLQHQPDLPVGQLGINQYMQTKAMLTCFAVELARMLKEKNSKVTCNIFFPGAVKSKLADKVLFQVNPMLARFAEAAYSMSEGILIRTPQQGATLGIYLCSTHKRFQGGLFHSGLTGEVTDFTPHEAFGMSSDQELCRKLWGVTGKLLNQALGKESKVAEWWDFFKPSRKPQL